jgi:hypothetical protein
MGIFGSPTKVPGRDFRGGYRHSRLGKKLRSIPKGIINDAERRTVYDALNKRGREGGGLTRLETQGAIREMINNKSDNISRSEARHLKKHLGKITGYSNLKSSGQVTERYSRADRKGKLY